MTAILASAYDYDYSSDNEDETVASVTESFAYLDDDDDFNPGNGDDEDEPTISQTNTWDSFDYGTEVSQHSEGASQVDGKSDTAGPTSYPPEQRGSQRKSLRGGKSTASNSKVKRSLRRKEKNKDLAALARTRHRRRRYELFSNFLLSAAELLLLDRSQGLGFLPMLDRLLTPTPQPSTTKASSKSSSKNQRERLRWRRNSSRNSETMATSPEKSASEEFRSEQFGSSHASISSPGHSDVVRSDFSPPASVTTESSVHSEFSNHGWEDDDRDSLTKELDNDESLRPFLESLSPGSGFRCLSLLLLQHLLHSTEGYDARIRHVLKKLGVVVLVQEMKQDANDFLPSGWEGKASWSNDDFVDAATRKFEALEHAIAWKILHLSTGNRKNSRRGSKSSGNDAAQGSARKKGVSREQIVRGLKIGGAGIVAGTLFAVTGGLAAPGIAAGVAAVAGGSAAATAAVVTLTSSAAITAIFGVGGGGLAAYKMQRRTQGLTEFEFQKESGSERDRDGHPVETKVEPELFSTICLSGWLRDKYDFQRPWGVTPTNPRLKDRQELLERFYAVYKPEYIPRCSKILSKWKGQERELWQYLRETYGSDPSQLLPLDDGPRHQAALTHEQTEIVDNILNELGFSTDKRSHNTCLPPRRHRKPPGKSHDEDGFTPNESKTGWRKRLMNRSHRGDRQSSACQTPQKTGLSSRRISTPLSDSLHESSTPDGVSLVSSGVDSNISSTSSSFQAKEEMPEKENNKPPKHVSTVWDYQSIYGGEQYTVKWESSLLLELSDSVEDLALDMMGGATAHVLKQTAFSTLLSAIALPYVLVNAANMIDGTWTLAIERSEEAGKELARSLLFSRAGHRPVVLVGFSMGARTIYTCLKELARYQEQWEELKHERDEESVQNRSSGADKGGNAQEIFERMREPASIVEDAILMGMPNHLSLSSWTACRRIVAGRLVNCYSRKDLVLSLMFQFKRLSGGLKPVCGTCPVLVHGVENVDVSDLVSSHQDYCLVTGDILQRVRHGQPLRRQFEVVDVGGNEND